LHVFLATIDLIGVGLGVSRELLEIMQILKSINGVIEQKNPTCVVNNPSFFKCMYFTKLRDFKTTELDLQFISNIYKKLSKIDVSLSSFSFPLL